MMNPYFSNETRKNELRNELSNWANTSFMYNCGGKAQPGGVADCVSFPLNVFKRLGLIPDDYTTPSYVSVRSGENELVKIYDGIDKINGLIKVWEIAECPLADARLMFGDIIVCSSGRAIQHFLIFTGDGLAWHCWPKSGVVKIPIITAQIHKTAKRVYRFHE